MEWESPPSYTDDDRGSWNYPNYGLPKVLPLLLSTVVVLVTHAVRLATIKPNRMSSTYWERRLLTLKDSSRCLATPIMMFFLEASYDW